MSSHSSLLRKCRQYVLLPAIVAWVVAAGSILLAGTTGTNIVTGNVGAVGGVMVSPDGLLANATRDALGDLQRFRAEALRDVPDGMGRTAQGRKVSLAGLEREIQKSIDSGKQLPVAVQCLAGLQRVTHVLVYPEDHDIVLVGPAEAWKVDDRGNIIGAKNGRPVMLLDDLVVALRASGGRVRTVLSCSIDPTPEGYRRVQAAARRTSSADPRTAAAAMEENLGPQKITIQGLPETSHFAHVMVAADYRMKRVSLALEPSPVSGLPSFLDMAKAGRGLHSSLPRWWLEPSYEGLVRDPQGLAWELRGGKVKTMTETDFFDANGIQHPTGQSDPVAQRWADIMTERYEDLSRADPIFGELRNCMDMAVVAALIMKEDLLAKAGNRLPLLTGEGPLHAAKLRAPKQVATQAAPFRKGNRWMIAAGGVQINPWAIVGKAKTDETVVEVHKAAAPKRTHWWWD